MGNLNYIVFGGVDSRDYGIYISGEGVFNAPERDVEVVNIPGKDGDLLIDRGRFLNIEVTYPGFNFEPDLSTFAERLRAFRAALASQVGYQRLEDSFHPDEFRLASFRSGLDVNPVMYNTASTFDIVFDCKPQRFLKSGEEEITIGEWGETQTVSGSIATFEAESNTGIKSLVAQIEPKQEGSGDPSPSNVRPISGWDSIKAYISGKNLSSINVISQVSWATRNNIFKDIINSLKEGVYKISFKVTVDSASKTGAWNYGLVLQNMSFTHNNKSGGTDPKVGDVRYFSETLIVDSNNRGKCTNVYFYGCGSSDQGIMGTATISELQIEFRTKTDYEPYQGQTITKSLGRTVYGGTLDLVSGVLTVTHEIYSFTGNETIATATIGSHTRFGVGGVLAQNVQTDSAQYAYCSHFKCANSPMGGNAIDNAMGAYQKSIYWRADSFADANAMKTYFANQSSSGTPCIYVGKLATPTTYQLTAEQISTILGVNNIWADSGEVSVEYGEDPNLLINPSPFEALPLIEVVGTGSLTVGNITMTITGDSTQDIFIDSDIMEAYEDDNGAIISRNNRISLSGMHFPTLGTETGIAYTGLTSVTVTPRWWTI